MITKETKLKGCVVIEPTIFQDNRGYFFESFNQKKFNELVNQEVCFIQDNESFSSKGVLRGLHYQIGKYSQAKLVRVIHGEVLDVAVDIRKGSSTFGQHIAIKLSGKNKKQLFIPRGFAHGFLVLSNTATFSYKCDNLYNKSAEGGIIYNDDQLKIDWGIYSNQLMISDKDLILPTLKNAKF